MATEFINYAFSKNAEQPILQLGFIRSFSELGCTDEATQQHLHAINAIKAMIRELKAANIYHPDEHFVIEGQGYYEKFIDNIQEKQHNSLFYSNHPYRHIQLYSTHVEFPLPASYLSNQDRAKLAQYLSQRHIEHRDLAPYPTSVCANRPHINI